MFFEMLCVRAHMCVCVCEWIGLCVCVCEWGIVCSYVCLTLCVFASVCVSGLMQKWQVGNHLPYPCSHFQFCDGRPSGLSCSL